MSHFESISESAEFDAPAATVWKLLVDWSAIADWMPGGYIQSLRMEGDGIGAIRHLVTGQGVHVAERLDQANEATGELHLSLVGSLPWNLLSYHARGKLESVSDRRSRLTWRGRLELPRPGVEAVQVVTLLRKSYLKMFLGIRRKVESCEN